MSDENELIIKTRMKSSGYYYREIIRLSLSFSPVRKYLNLFSPSNQPPVLNHLRSNKKVSEHRGLLVTQAKRENLSGPKQPSSQHAGTCSGMSKWNSTPLTKAAASSVLCI